MAKYDDQFPPVKAKHLRRIDRCHQAFNKALKDSDRFWHYASGIGRLTIATYERRKAEVEGNLKKAADALDAAYAAYREYEYGDRPDGN